MCYSNKDVEGPTITGKYGNDMFYRTREEIETLYSDLKERDHKEGHLGKRLHHIAHYFIFER